MRKLKLFLLGLAIPFVAFAGLETGTFIDDLVVTNPTGTDDYATADDHIRLLKTTVKNTFPNIDGEVSVTQDELNLLDGETGTVWTSDNDGDASGLDADTIDTIESTSIALVETGFFTVTWENACTTSPSHQWRYAKAGDVVTFYAPGSVFNCTSNSLSFTAGTDIPASLRPNGTVLTMTRVRDAGANDDGCIAIHSDGEIEVWLDCIETNDWTNSGQKRLVFVSISYPVT